MGNIVARILRVRTKKETRFSNGGGPYYAARASQAIGAG